MKYLVSTAHAHDIVIGENAVETISDAGYDSVLFVYNAPFETVIGTFILVLTLLGATIAARLFWQRFKEHKKGRKISIPQWIVWFYASQLYLILALVYIPGFTDDKGTLFNLFKLDLIDDLLHLGSAIWATWAAWRSRKQALIYLAIFGFFYAIDGLIGIFAGRSLLSLNIFFFPPKDRSFLLGVAANAPHVIIGSLALVSSAVLSRLKK